MRRARLLPLLVPDLLVPDLLVAALLVAALLGSGCAVVGRGGPAEAGTATVVRVVDGDTLDVRLGRAVETVRLLGIDTPETVEPGAPVDCFGPEASARTKELLPTGTEVRLARDAEARDRYGRLLVYLVRVRDDLFVNRSLLADGFARPLSIAPNEAHRAELAAAAAEARAAGRGLWGACPAEAAPAPRRSDGGGR
ncbi:thermonuclease family protein [Iamia sp. SCSIO 61187]|uniref:thermonuclease family protein n=1 Tax=Iamia sp. SCSIO 61187 TaxID=2722752 RepID=UPI001C631AC0|nr:thermonuclease family protein [Iamia sp. SCSIO 61187]QYG92044.1 thermonuclease family protein [Iamia sp. SCSIO 61187]